MFYILLLSPSNHVSDSRNKLENLTPSMKPVPGNYSTPAFVFFFFYFFFVAWLMRMHQFHSVNVIYLVNKAIQMFEKYVFAATPCLATNHNKMVTNFHN